MSINETFQRPSNLTPTQQRDQMGAIYGVGGGTASIDPNNLTPEQAETIRSLLGQYDHAHSQIAEFDLNRPPLQVTNPAAKSARYIHQEFPRMVFHHERRTTDTVQNQAQLDYYLARGWSKEPFPPSDEDIVDPIGPLTPENAEGAAMLDAEIRRAKQAKK